jgi:aspartate/methionine/tyrosine aminotransferase
MALPDEYYAHLSRDYGERRDAMLKVLEATGFKPFRPGGAYYIMADISGFGYPDDMAFTRHLIEDAGVAAVPGSSFFEKPEEGSQLIRFCFCKKYETLKEAQDRLARI